MKIHEDLIKKDINLILSTARLKELEDELVSYVIQKVNAANSEGYVEGQRDL